MGADRPLVLASLEPYGAILLLIAVAATFVLAILVITHLVGPSRKGEVKDETYESGMPLITDARRRFNLRFYIVAMLFLLFDVEVVFLWPWAPVFYDAAVGGETTGPFGAGKGFLLAEMAVFFAILLVGYVYAWRKGVFRWN
ncbi:MAG: NADH-quinone oxidoreductase subunit A [Planctomycetota bacterium]|jgi:NADH-quinone oxidoreductase subunit A